MFDVIAFLLLVPIAILAIRFWIGVLKWLLRHKRTLGKRVQRVRSAFAEDEP